MANKSTERPQSDSSLAPEEPILSHQTHYLRARENGGHEVVAGIWDLADHHAGSIQHL